MTMMKNKLQNRKWRINNLYNNKGVFKLNDAQRNMLKRRGMGRTTLAHSLINSTKSNIYIPLAKK